MGCVVYVGGSGYEEVLDLGVWGFVVFFFGLVGLKFVDDGWEKI